MAGGITTPEHVAAVSNAGGLGSIGAGYLSPEQLRSSIQEIKQLTNKPFGVNLFIPENPNVSDEKIERANEWLKPFREQLHILEILKVKKMNLLLKSKSLSLSKNKYLYVALHLDFYLKKLLSN